MDQLTAQRCTEKHCQSTRSTPHRNTSDDMRWWEGRWIYGFLVGQDSYLVNHPKMWFYQILHIFWVLFLHGFPIKVMVFDRPIFWIWVVHILLWRDKNLESSYSFLAQARFSKYRTIKLFFVKCWSFISGYLYLLYCLESGLIIIKFTNKLKFNKQYNSYLHIIWK